MKSVARLTDLKVRKLTTPGLHADGAGLYLQVSRSSARSWILRFTINGKAREMGLGSASTVSLAEARELAIDARRLLQQGIDPLEAKRAKERAAKLQVAQSITFADCARQYIATNRVGWRNAKHASQWENTLKTYVEPILGALSVQEVDTGLVLKALEPIWSKKPETATRVRGRIEVVLDWAAARGYRSGENPARWRGHLDKILPKRSKVRTVKHHAALPYTELPAFMAKLRAQEGTAARALEFLILTAARTSEVLGAVVAELNYSDKVWSVPASRMKAGREHRVPLSATALAVAKAIDRNKGIAHLFPGARAGKSLSNMSLLAVLKRMGCGDLTVHGFRSTFRDWAAERTNHPREAIEMALAHTIESKVEAAYRRSDLFERRRKVMDAWEKFCSVEDASGQVVKFNKAN